MELIVLGVILCLVSSSYLGVASWSIVEFQKIRLYLGFALACSVSLTVAAFCGIFSGRRTHRRRMAVFGCLLFGAFGFVCAVPAIALTIIAMGNKTEVCAPCIAVAGKRVPCNGVCNAYDEIHMTLIVLDALELVVGFVLCGAACCAICCKTASTRSPSSRETAETQSFGSTLASFN